MVVRPRNRTAGGGPDARRLGFRRIAFVRVMTGQSGTRFEVDGVVHRRPMTSSVSARMASRLIASGVPMVVRHDADRDLTTC